MKISRLVLATLLAGAVPASAQIGSVVRSQKLNEVSGGLVGPLPPLLGIALTAIGDLNGDGVGDLVAGLPTDNGGGPSRGAVLVVFLKTDGTVAGQQKISQTLGGFGVTLPDGARFGLGVTALGDLDGDGRQELAVLTRQPASTWILFLNADGTVRTRHEIPWSDPVFGGTTLASDFRTDFVPGLVGLGDLDGDGLGDFALGAPRDDDGDLDAGAVWILHLNADGTAKSAKKISQASGAFAGDLESESLFGHSLTRLGDLNGDGFQDLAVGEFGGGHRRWMLLLDGNQDVLGASHALPLTENLDALGDLDGDGLSELASEGWNVRFVSASAQPRKVLGARPGIFGPTVPLGDLDGDGTPEVAAGDFTHRETGGAIFVLSLATSPVRNGTGVNPLIYAELAEPVVGQTWNATLDCSAHASGLASIFGFQRPLAGTFLSGGELLVDPSSALYFHLVQPHSGGVVGFSAAIPASPSLVSLVLYTQGACTGATGFTLSNALDIQVGG